MNQILLDVSRARRFALAAGLLVALTTLLAACAGSSHFRQADQQSWRQICTEPNENFQTIDVGGACGERMYALATEAACLAGDPTGCALGALQWRLDANPLRDVDRAIELGELGCEMGDTASCAALSVTLTYGSSSQYRRGIRLQKELCSKSSAQACYSLGTNLPNRAEAKRSQKVEVAFNRQSCKLEHPAGCRRAARSYAKGRGVERDPKRAQQLYAKACRLHDKHACEEIGEERDEDAPNWHNRWLLLTHTDVARMYEAGCENGFRHSCTRLGRLLETKRLSPRGWNHNEAAAEAFTSGCDRGAPESCHSLAGYYKRGTGGLEADLEKASTLAQKACRGGFAASCDLQRELKAETLEEAQANELAARCEAGRAEACYVAARAFREGREFEADPERALSLFEQGCENGDKAACIEAADSYAKDEDFEKANEAWEMGCELGAAEACHELGHSLRRGRGLEPDAPRAFKLALRACDLGSFGGCGGAAIHLIEGSGVEQDLERARELAHLGCRGSTLWSCNNYGQLARDGDGGDKDAEEARSFFEWTCKEGSQIGCALAEGVGKARIVDDAQLEPTAAIELYETACHLGGASSCRALGDIFKDKDAANYSPQRALQLYERGCRLDDGKSCNRALGLIAGTDELERSEPSRMNLREKSCELGTATQCRAASKRYRFGEDGVPVDRERADKLHARAVEVGSKKCRNEPAPVQCYRTAHFIAHGRGTDTDFPAARKFLEDACADEVPGACMYIAQERVKGEIYPRDPERGVRELEALCADGELIACFNHGLALWMGVPDFDPAGSTEIFDNICEEAGTLPACANAGFAYALVDRDLDAALERFDKTCATERRYACPPFSHILMSFEPEALGDRNLFELAAEECEGGSKYDCLIAGRLLQNGFQVEADLERARKLYEKACDEKLDRACSRVRLLDVIEVPSPNPESLERDCDEGHARACLRIGADHEFSSTEPARLARAGDYYRRACEAGSADGCTLLLAVGRDSKGLIRGRDPLQLNMRKCELGGALDCYTSGEFIDNYDWEVGIEQHRRACELGEKRSCRILLRNGYSLPEADGGGRAEENIE